MNLSMSITWKFQLRFQNLKYYILKYNQFQSVVLSSDVKYFSGHFVIMIIIFSSLLQSFVVVFLFRIWQS